MNNELTILVEPMWIKSANHYLELNPGPIAGTVSSKGSSRWGWTCIECNWVWYPPEDTQEYPIHDPYGEFYPVEELIANGWKKFPNKRCKSCRSAMKRWQTARKVFIELDELRLNEGIDYLRFVTFTRRSWNCLVSEASVESEKNKLKKRAIAKFRKWRQRNAWWISRNANGQYWAECVETLEENGMMRLHFHVHCVLVCEYLDNRPRKHGDAVTGDSKCYTEWGRVMDVRAIKDHQVPYQVAGKTRKGCGRKACMRYLSKYISKAKGWRSQPIGKWKYDKRN